MIQVTLGKRKKKWRCTPCRELDLKVPTANGTGWSDWGEWTACSVTCTVGTRRKQRLCNSPNLDECEGDGEMTTQCTESPSCPGKYGSRLVSSIRATLQYNSWTFCKS